MAAEPLRVTRCPPLSRRALLSSLGALGIGSGALVAAGDDDSDGSDWPMYRRDPAGTAHASDASVPREKPSEQWRHESQHSGLTTPSPILYDGRVFFARESLTTLDAETGNRRNRIESQDQKTMFLSTPAIASARAYRTPALVASSKYGLQAVGIDGGPDLPILEGSGLTRRWTTGQQPENPAIASLNFGSHWRSPPVAAGRTVFAADNGITAVDASSGSILWSESHRRIDFRPAVVDGGVYVASYDGTVRELAAGDGRTRWIETHADLRPEAQPVVANGRIYVAHEGGVTAVNTDDGTHLWTGGEPTGEYGRYVTPPAVTADALFVAGTALFGEEEDALVALDAETGERLWDVPLSSVTVDTDGPVVAGDVVLQAAGHHLYAVDAATGELLWRVGRDAPVAQPAIGDGRVFLPDGFGLSAYGGA